MHVSYYVRKKTSRLEAEGGMVVSKPINKDSMNRNPRKFHQLLDTAKR